MKPTFTPVPDTDPDAGLIDYRMSATPTEGCAIQLPSGLIVILHDQPATASFVGIDILRPDASLVDSYHYGRPKQTK